MGYHGVEFAGLHGFSPADVKKMLSDHGLIACGMHKSLKAFSRENLNATIDAARSLQCPFLIVGMMWNFTRNQWLRKAARLNEIAASLQPHGLYLGYHAHAHDFRTYGGQTAWDLIFENTKPDVIMQLDTGNCQHDGADPVAVLHKYPGRARTIHLKAFGSRESIIGQDRTHWSAVFDWCESAGKTEWYVVEYSKCQDPMRMAGFQIDALRKLGKL